MRQALDVQGEQARGSRAHAYERVQAHAWSLTRCERGGRTPHRQSTCSGRSAVPARQQDSLGSANLRCLPRPSERRGVRIAVATAEALVRLGARPLAGEGTASRDVVKTAARLQTREGIGPDQAPVLPLQRRETADKRAAPSERDLPRPSAHLHSLDAPSFDGDSRLGRLLVGDLPRLFPSEHSL